MSKYFVFALLYFVFAPGLYGQSDSIVKKYVSVTRGVRTHSKLVAMPKSLTAGLTKIQVMNGFLKSDHFASQFRNKNNPRTSILRVTEYLQPSKKPLNNSKGDLVFGPYVSHREWYPCIDFGGTLYVFTEQDVPIDTEMFNLFLSESELRIEDKKDAKDLVFLYFSATRGYFENKGKLILSKVEDVSRANQKDYRFEANRLRTVIKPLDVRLKEGMYVAELYTWEISLGEVTKWYFKIRPEAEIEVQSELIGKF